MKGLGGSPRRCAGGKYVVDQQDVLFLDRGRMGNGKGSAQIDAAHARCEPCLALGSADTHQRAGGKGETPLGMAFGQRLERMDGERPRLVEAALSIFGLVQRDGDDQQLDRASSASCAIA